MILHTPHTGSIAENGRTMCSSLLRLTDDDDDDDDEASIAN